jgi:hypothetical protein
MVSSKHNIQIPFTREIPGLLKSLGYRYLVVNERDATGYALKEPTLQWDLKYLSLLQYDLQRLPEVELKEGYLHSVKLTVNLNRPFCVACGFCSKLIDAYLQRT